MESNSLNLPFFYNTSALRFVFPIFLTSQYYEENKCHVDVFTEEANRAWAWRCGVEPWFGINGGMKNWRILGIRLWPDDFWRQNGLRIWSRQNCKTNGIRRPLKNETFFCQARKAKILTGGIHYVFRGLKFEAWRRITKKWQFCKGLIRISLN